MVPIPEREIAPAPSGPISIAQRKVAAILETGGIRVGGDRSWDLQVNHPGFFERALTHGNLGAGEAYMDGWWDVQALDEFFARLLAADPCHRIGRLAGMALAARDWLLNRQSQTRSLTVAQSHYDLGNDLYEAMLGRRMQYTCGYWAGAATLDEAQERKLDLIRRKLYIEPGMTVLDLGCGFGGLAHYLAAEWGCRVVSYNISSQQVEYARDLCRGLPVRIELRDYRDAANEPEPFDRVVAVGLCEHIGPKNFRAFFELAYRTLRDKGLFLLHTIGSNVSATSIDPWVDRYIFPNGVIPSIAYLGRAMEPLWTMEDWHNFGPDYDKTLMAWWSNFARAWPRLRDRYGERFYRMWRYYLMSSAGAFRARRLQLWQVVLSKSDIGSYTPVR